MGQDPVESLPRFIGYDVLVLNTSDDSDRSAVAAATRVRRQNLLDRLRPDLRDALAHQGL